HPPGDHVACRRAAQSAREVDLDVLLVELDQVELSPVGLDERREYLAKDLLEGFHLVGHSPRLRADRARAVNHDRALSGLWAELWGCPWAFGGRPSPRDRCPPSWAPCSCGGRRGGSRCCDRRRRRRAGPGPSR